MAKLIIICCFLWFTGLSALPIIDLDEIPQPADCPADSYKNDTLGSCSCLPCPEVTTTSCSQVLVEVSVGNGEPGSCCPQYECSESEPVCNGTNVKYFPNKCTKCESCNSHAIRCIQFCELPVVATNCLTIPNETAVPLGGTWTEDEGCTLCRCTLDGMRDCQVTECLPVECDRPIRKEGDCCQTCPDEAPAPPPYISVLQPSSGTVVGPTRGPDTEAENPEEQSSTDDGSSSTSAAGLPLTSDANEFSSTIYVYSYAPSSTTDVAEVSSEAVDNIVSSESPQHENNFTEDLALFSTDSSMVSSTDPTIMGPASTTEASSVSDPATWTRQISSEAPNTERKSTLEPEALTPESTSQIKGPASEDMDPRDARNNTEQLPCLPPKQLDSISKWVWPLLVALVLAATVLGLVVCRICKGGKKVKGHYHEVSTQQPQEVCNLTSFDDPHRKQ